MTLLYYGRHFSTEVPYDNVVVAEFAVFKCEATANSLLVMQRMNSNVMTEL